MRKILLSPSMSRVPPALLAPYLNCHEYGPQVSPVCIHRLSAVDVLLSVATVQVICGTSGSHETGLRDSSDSDMTKVFIPEYVSGVKCCTKLTPHGIGDITRRFF
jgi:hypothetical protein